ncbi:MAG: hypothetical protein WBX81_04020, partial [Nitrososphaeraceae archaeon]
SSNASPLVIFSCSATLGSTRAIFLPTSRCSDSATFKVAPLDPLLEASVDSVEPLGTVPLPS